MSGETVPPEMAQQVLTTLRRRRRHLQCLPEDAS